MKTGRNPKAVTLGAVVSAMLGVLLVVNGLWVMGHCGKLRGAQKGKAAPEVALRTLSGERVNTGSLRGHVIVLDFWALWCGPCVRKFPHLEALQDEFAERGLRVLAVNVERSETSMRTLAGRRNQARKAKGLGPSKVTLLKGDGRASFAYGVQTLPHVVVVGRDGKIAYQHRGGGGADALRQQVIKALVVGAGSTAH